MSDNAPKQRPRGFALLSPERMAQVASAGGRQAHAEGHAHQWTRKQAQEAARHSVAVRMAPRWVSSDGAIMLRVLLADALECFKPGPCDEALLALSRQPYIARQLRRISPQAARFALRPFGAWSEYELRDTERNLQRMLWLACCDIREQARG